MMQKGNVILQKFNQKAMCKVINSLLHRNHESKLPAHESAKDMAEKFSHFIVNKIMNIRKDLLEMQRQVECSRRGCRNTEKRQKKWE